MSIKAVNSRSAQTDTISPHDVACNIVCDTPCNAGCLALCAVSGLTLALVSSAGSDVAGMVAGHNLFC